MRPQWPLTTSDYNEIQEVGNIALEPDSLQGAQDAILKALADVFHAESASFFIRDTGSMAIKRENIALLNLSRYYTRKYVEYYNELDPFIKGMFQRGACRDNDIMPSSAMKSLEYYSDFIKPQRISHLMVIYLYHDRKLLGHIGIHRHGNSRSFSLKDLYKAKLLGRVLTLDIRQKQLASESTNIKNLLQHVGEFSSEGIVILDSDLTPVYWNNKASQMVVTPGGHLVKPVLVDGHQPVIHPDVMKECIRLKESISFDQGMTRREDSKVVSHRCQIEGINAQIDVLAGSQGAFKISDQFYYLVSFGEAERIGIGAGVTGYNGWKLTPKETEIVRHICRGLTNKEISSHLGVSLPTVATHVQHIFEKMGVTSRTKLIFKMRSV